MGVKTYLFNENLLAQVAGNLVSARRSHPDVGYVIVTMNKVEIM